MDSNTVKIILETLDRGESASLTLSADGTTYTRRFIPGDRLILLGGGHVSLDVYHMAFMLGFDVVAVDDRPEFCNKQRFPKAQVLCDSFENAIRKLHISARDYVCVLTRGHRWDRQCITAILSGEMPYYLGMISSRRRADGLRELLVEEGYDSAKISRIHAPIGLNIGAMTTMEIALSICAEMIAEKRKIKTSPIENELIQNNVNIKMLRYLAESDESRALITVLSSTGSTPVKSGSMMAVNRLGKGYGTVGGGCGEAAAIAKARQIIGTGSSTVYEVEMTDDVAAEDGMVCGGVMSFLIEDITD
ncbi:XdhC family protein [uncultured Ruminococcus sp.]|uniref:XdhC family protein n=1 Tax=uncultured Ruminococcus sp. TaxID=165186 RepID=UPI00292FEE67|nr:XdhC family protein [uncultured Ruminococcus sp.]